MGTKFVKEVGPIRRQALRDVQNITRANVNPCVVNKRECAGLVIFSYNLNLFLSFCFDI